MSILEAHNTRRQFLTTLLGGAAIAVAGPILPPALPAASIEQLHRLMSEMAVLETHGISCWVVQPRVWREWKHSIARANYYESRRQERLMRRIDLGLPVGKPCA